MKLIVLKKLSISLYWSFLLRKLQSRVQYFADFLSDVIYKLQPGSYKTNYIQKILHLGVPLISVAPYWSRRHFLFLASRNYCQSDSRPSWEFPGFFILRQFFWQVHFAGQSSSEDHV